jgi:hypothetical protein
MTRLIDFDIFNYYPWLWKWFWYDLEGLNDIVGRNLATYTVGTIGVIVVLFLSAFVYSLSVKKNGMIYIGKNSPFYYMRLFTVGLKNILDIRNGVDYWKDLIAMEMAKSVKLCGEFWFGILLTFIAFPAGLFVAGLILIVAIYVALAVLPLVAVILVVFGVRFILEVVFDVAWKFLEAVIREPLNKMRRNRQKQNIEKFKLAVDKVSASIAETPEVYKESSGAKKRSKKVDYSGCVTDSKLDKHKISCLLATFVKYSKRIPKNERVPADSKEFKSFVSNLSVRCLRDLMAILETVHFRSSRRAGITGSVFDKKAAKLITSEIVSDVITDSVTDAEYSLLLAHHRVSGFGSLPIFSANLKELFLHTLMWSYSTSGKYEELIAENFSRIMQDLLFTQLFDAHLKAKDTERRRKKVQLFLKVISDYWNKNLCPTLEVATDEPEESDESK